MKLVHKLAAKELGKKIRGRYPHNPMSVLSMPPRDSDSGKLLESLIKRRLIEHTGLRSQKDWANKEYKEVTDDNDPEDFDDECYFHEMMLSNVDFKKHFPFTREDIMTHEEEDEDVIKELHDHVTSGVFKKK